MIVDGFFIAGAIVCALALILGVVATVIRDHPDDYALVAVAAVELFLVVYAVAAAVRQAGGQAISGEPWEFWGYLHHRAADPADRLLVGGHRQDAVENMVLAAAGVTVFVMLYSMEQIWDGALPA